MKIKIIYTLTILMLIIGSSLKAQNSYYPIEAGKVRLYKYGGAYAAMEGQKSKIEISQETTSIHGKTYFTMKTFLQQPEGFTPIQTIYIRNGDNGAIYTLMNEEQANETVLFPKAPWAVGTVWTPEGTTTPCKIIDMSASIDTPTKTFDNCLVVEVNLGETITKSYHQEGIGIVAITMMIEGKEMLMQYLIE